MQTKRIQLTLFVDPAEAVALENIRSRFNPVQYRLIKGNVTLCRQDELADIKTVQQNLINLKHSCITIEFGYVNRFAEGNGVLIPARGDNKPFRELRNTVLEGAIKDIRIHAAYYINTPTQFYLHR